MIETTYKEALNIIGPAPLVYEKTIELIEDDGALFNIISYKQYNCKKGRHFEGNT